MRGDACIASVTHTATAFIVTTKDALLFGISVLGVATTAGTVVACRGVANTDVVFWAPVAGTASKNDIIMTPIVCAGGISCTCVGTNFNYIVLYTDL